MFQTNNINSKKFIPLILIAIGIGGLFLYQYLTFIPEYSSAINTITTTDPSQGATLGDITYMQEITPQICANTPEADADDNNQFILQDNRDHKSYYVAKLADGNCWMTQNLAFNPTGIELTSDNTDLSPGSKITLANSPWSSSNTAVMWGESTIGTGHDSYGYYYSWPAATANTANVAELTGSSAKGKDASGSICPKGWRLPFDTNSTSADVVLGEKATWKELLSKYDITKYNSKLHSAPLYLVRAGYGDSNGLVSSAGTGGSYFSSTAGSSTNVYDMDFNSSSGYFSTSDNDLRHRGRSIRCVVISSSLYPEEKPTAPLLPTPAVSVEIPKLLTLSLSTKELSLTPTSNRISTATFSATVSSNDNYNILISPSEHSSPDLTSEQGNTISALSTNQSLTDSSTTNAWGIKCTNSTNCKTTNYLGLTTTPQIFYTGIPSLQAETLFEVGIKVDSSLPSGTYSTNITVTASQ